MNLRFLLTGRWIGLLVFVIALGGVCIMLGNWQWSKLDKKAADNDQVRAHLNAQPVPLDSAVPVGDAVTKGLQWTQVTATGVFDLDEEIIVKFINRDGTPGIEVLTPLVLDDGTAMLVDRGFMATNRTNERPEGVPAPAAGEVTVSGWLRTDSNAGETATRPDAGQIRAVNSEVLAETMPYDLRSGYIDLQSQDPAPRDSSLIAEPVPDLGQGPHLFYAIQWWFFAMLAVVGYGWFARIEVKSRQGDEISVGV